MSWGSCREAAVVRPHAETDDLQLPFSDPAQQRYELIRPLLLDPERTATQRAQETGTHPETVGRLKRLFDQQGRHGLVPDTLDAHPLTLTIALNLTAILHHLCREALLTQARAEAVMTIATEQGFPVQLANATPLQGWALAACGRGAEGLTQLQHGLAASQAIGAVRDRPYHLALFAEVSAQAGQTTAGLEALAEALVMLPKSGARWWEAELYRFRGALLLQHAVAQPEEAEACFQQALDIARRQEAKSLELRAAMSLVRLWQSQGKRAKAYELLAPVYGWFTEGFDTADLQEAKALLEDLED